MRNQRPYLNIRAGVLVVALATLPLIPLKLNPYLPPPRNEGPKAQSTVDAPDPDFEPVFTQTITPTVDMSAGFPINPYEKYLRELPRYERVPCGDIDDDVCYEICLYDRCYTFGNDDDRVGLFVEHLNKIEQLEDELDILRKELVPALWDAAGTCVAAGAGAGAAYIAVTAAAAPEPTISKAIAIVAAVGAGLACIGVVWSAWQVESAKQSQVEEKIVKARNDAEFEFNSLEASPPKGSENE